MNTVVVNSWAGSYKLKIDSDGFGIITNDAKIAFSSGQCHALAFALHELTGWVIRGFGGSKLSPYHCAVYCPQLKRYVDIKGTFLLKDVSWKKISNKNINPDLIPDLALDHYLVPNMDAAKPFAKSVLKGINQLLKEKGFSEVPLY